jgi:hypothetical protein
MVNYFYTTKYIENSVEKFPLHSVEAGPIPVVIQSRT